jgi:hypothetical protein
MQAPISWAGKRFILTEKLTATAPVRQETVP